MRESLRTWQLADSALASQCELVVSELVTNALTHANGRIALALSHWDAGGVPVVRIAVQDDSLAEPVVRCPEDDDPHGRGLRIVELLAQRWGVERLPGGKQVWAELAAAPG